MILKKMCNSHYKFFQCFCLNKSCIFLCHLLRDAWLYLFYFKNENQSLKMESMNSIVAWSLSIFLTIQLNVYIFILICPSLHSWHSFLMLNNYSVFLLLIPSCSYYNGFSYFNLLVFILVVIYSILSIFYF